MGYASDATAINVENAIRLGDALLKPGPLFGQRPYDNFDDLMQRPLEPPCDGGG